jgi:hypothetical protein
LSQQLRCRLKLDSNLLEEKLDLMATGASTQTHTQMLLDYPGVIWSVTATCVAEYAPSPHPGYNAAPIWVEPEDLARFENESGPEAPDECFSNAEATKTTVLGEIPPSDRKAAELIMSRMRIKQKMALAFDDSTTAE